MSKVLVFFVFAGLPPGNQCTALEFLWYVLLCTTYSVVSNGERIALFFCSRVPLPTLWLP